MPPTYPLVPMGFRSGLSNNMTGNTDIERQSGWGSTGDRHQIWNLNAVPGNGDLRQFWNAAYTSIRDCNIAIEGIEASAFCSRQMRRPSGR